MWINSICWTHPSNQPNPTQTQQPNQVTKAQRSNWLGFTAGHREARNASRPCSIFRRPWPACVPQTAPLSLLQLRKQNTAFRRGELVSISRMILSPQPDVVKPHLRRALNERCGPDVSVFVVRLHLHLLSRRQAAPLGTQCTTTSSILNNQPAQ